MCRDESRITSLSGSSVLGWSICRIVIKNERYSCYACEYL